MWQRPQELELTAREKEILELLREGLTDEKIADRLEISPPAARHQVAALLAKLGLRSREEALLWRPSRPAAPARPSSADRRTVARRRPRLTPLRAVGLALVLLVVALYVWSIFFSSDAPPPHGLSVRWLPVDPPPYEVVEHPRPYVSLLAGPGEDIWRAYVVHGDGEPRLLLEGRRLLVLPSWSLDGQHVLLGFYSQSMLRESLSGYTAVEVANGRQVWERLLPFRPGIAGRGQGLLVLSGDSLQPGGRATGLYVIEADGLSRRLEGPWDYVGPVAWSPDGRSLLVQGVASATAAAGGYREGSEFFVLTPYLERALRAGNFRSPPVFSPDGRKLAGRDSGDIVVLELESGRQRRVSIAAAGTPRQADPAFSRPVIAWSSNGRYLSYAGSVIDTEEMRLLAAPEQGISFSAVSPDGRWLASGSATWTCTPPGSERTENVNRLMVKELAGERILTLFDCDAGYSSVAQWLSSERLLVSAVRCPARTQSAQTAAMADCAVTYFLASLPDGQPRPLAESPMDSTSSTLAISREGRILTGGDAVRVFRQDGTLLRTIAAPPGLLVNGLAWSPDGNSFVYVVGPRVRSLVPGFGGPTP